MEDFEYTTLGLNAMATRFEFMLWGAKPSDLQAAAYAAIEEIRRLEDQLSIYRDNSETTEINLFAAQRPVIVDPRLFQFLQHARRLHDETRGAFDITVGPLIRAWGFLGGSGAMADTEEIHKALELVGMQKIELIEEDHSVRFLSDGMMIDLGAIGKGYAIDRAADILRDCGIPGALLHGGTSSVAAVGARPDGTPWPIAVQHPMEPQSYLTIVHLLDNTLSVSAISGKCFQYESRRYGHVLDPRTGEPVQRTILAAVVGPSATDGDALSTGLMVGGENLFEHLRHKPETQLLLALEEDDGTLRFRSSLQELHFKEEASRLSAIE